MCTRASRFWDQTFPQTEFAKDIHIHGLIDRNSRMSFFEEGGTDVGRQSKNSRLNNGPDIGLGRLPGRPSKPVADVGRLVESD